MLPTTPQVHSEKDATSYIKKIRSIDRLSGDLKRPGFPVAGSVCVGEVEKMGKAGALWVYYMR